MPIINVVQLDASTSSAAPDASEITISDKHAPVPSTSTSTKTPSPAGIVPPVNEKPSTVDALVEIKNPAFSASAPLAPTTVTLSKSNWKPPITSYDVYKISIEPVSVGHSKLSHT